jgi:squalene-hopene/tetraprenyl-beta-curcumene cyclase
MFNRLPALPKTEPGQYVAHLTLCSAIREAPKRTLSQTAWALLGLMAAGLVEDKVVRVRYLTRTQAEDGFWKEERFTATGFPRVFFLRYHGYAKYFPLWAMARFGNLKKGNRHPVLVGM